jgi:tRNA nucleotidyltransferase (CCA-adding enzyme)
LTLLLAEEPPAAALALARAHGLLAEIHPALHWDAWLADRLTRRVGWVVPLAPVLVRLTLMAFRWPRETIEGFVGLLHPDGATREAVEALPVWRARRLALARASTGAAVAAALDGLPLATLAAARLAEDEPTVLRHLDWYVTDLSRRRPRLGGEALRQLGLAPGPAFRPLLAELRRAVLDGEVTDEAAEWQFLRHLVEQASAPDAPIER